MKKQIVIAILLSFGVSSLAALSLGINNKVIDQVTLKVGQTVTFQVSSNDAAKYSGYLGFDRDASLGTTFNSQVTAAAGNLASITTVTNTTFEGYYINAAGISPAPSAGIQFTFDYTAVTVGQTMLRLYDSSFAVILDSIVITNVPAQLGSGFTYQGRLIDDNTTPSGEYDIQFKLFNAPFEGSQLGSTIVLDETEVLDGYFTVELDFGSLAFNSNSVWLEVGVRPGNQHNPSPFTLLDPRQRLTPTPHATFASKSDWNTLLNLPSGFADGVDNDTDTHLTESQVEGYIANDVTSGYMPYSNGSKLLGTDLYYYPASQLLGFGSAAISNRKFNLYTNTQAITFYSANAVTTGSRYAVAGASTGDTTGSSYGVWGRSDSSTSSNYGLYGYAGVDSTGTNYGVYGIAGNETGDSFAGYFVGNTRVVGRLNHDYDLQIAADDGAEVAIGASVDPGRKLYVYTDSDLIAVHGQSANPSGDNYAVYGQATTGSTGTNYGVYGYAYNSGTGEAYAGYFVGDLCTTGRLISGGNVILAMEDTTHVGIGSIGSSTVKLKISNDSMTDTLNIANNKTSGNRYGVYVSNTGNTTGNSYGVTSSSSSATGSNYGVFGSAITASSGNNYGVYGYATNSGAGSAYAGYFVGNVYVTGDVSALSFTDRTPYPKDLQTAVDAVMSMSPLPAGQYQEGNKEMQLDHSSLSSFIRSEEGKRDLSATVSCHNEVLKDLLSKQKQLEEASLMITQDRATIAAQKEQILQLQSQVVQLQEQVKKMELLEQKMNMLLSAQ